MQYPSVRTSSHVYPQEELDAIRNFYDGQRCVIRRVKNHVEWAHIMDGAIPNERIFEMLTRKLCQDCHPQHTAEVRENVVPLTVEHHRSMDVHLRQSTLFLHEDILARTLDYEQDLRNWRIAELSAGRNDPGRPEYQEVFGGAPTTQHRYHARNSLTPFLRNVGSDAGPDFQIFSADDCPGVDNPDSQKNFPIIDTLLSIPFSLLHTLPRLTGIILSTYQQQLVTMSLEVISLWWWDPPPELIAKSEEVRRQNVDANQQDDTRKPKPHPIHHSSRNATTFETKKPTITYGTPSTPSPGQSLNQDPHIVEFSSGQIFVGGMLSLSRDKDGLNDELGGMEDVRRKDNGIFVGVTSSPMTSEAWSVQSPERIEGFDHIDSTDEDVEEKPAICRSSSDIMSWYEKVVDPRLEALPLTSTPYEKGVIGGSSTNDILMIKGLIDPRVYMQSLDLSRFSCL